MEDYPTSFLSIAAIDEAGFAVEVENDEVAGMKAALKCKPELIIFDISLPENEDFGFIREIKKPITKAIPWRCLPICPPRKM